MDAFAVTVTRGQRKEEKVKYLVFMAFLFGLFQGIMPLIGWIAGISVKDYIMNYDHWVAFIILSAIGGKMIFDTFSSDEEEEDKKLSGGFLVMIGLAIATSIDALAVGVSFSCMNISIFKATTIIGVVTFGLCLLGCRLARFFGKLLGNKMELIGGLVLCFIGIKILVEHIFFS